MRVIIIYLLGLTLSIALNQALAQEGNEALQYKIDQLEKKKVDVAFIERNILKQEVEFINSRLKKAEITSNEAQELKKKYAEKHAKNIENKTTILDNQIALIKRNGNIDLNTDIGQLMIGFNAEEDNGDRLFGIKYNSGNQSKVVFDKKTYSDLVIAAGFINSGANSRILSNSQFKQTKSRFFEVGYAWNTRVFKNSNWLRVKYGISFQFNGFTPNNKDIFVKNLDESGDPYAVYLVDSKEALGLNKELKKSKLRMDSFIFPIHFEFGPSNKKVNGKYARYDTDKKFKFGIGGYLGINYNTIQKIKYARNTVFDGTFPGVYYKDVQSTVKGLSAYVGFDDTSLYLKYESSSSIRRLIGQHVISLGLRFDL